MATNRYKLNHKRKPFSDRLTQVHNHRQTWNVFSLSKASKIIHTAIKANVCNDPMYNIYNIPIYVDSYSMLSFISLALHIEFTMYWCNIHISFVHWKYFFEHAKSYIFSKNFIPAINLKRATRNISNNVLLYLTRLANIVVCDSQPSPFSFIEIDYCSITWLL